MSSGGDVRSGRDFFEEPREWSGIKHRILEKYIRAYLRIRGSVHRDISVVDGFAGAGYYGEGATQKPGSPVLLARVSAEGIAKEQPYRVHCFYVERNTTRYAQLLQALQGSDSALIHTFRGRFEDHIQRILELMPRGPAVCFLDPFGVDGIELDKLRPLLKRLDTEILLNFSTPTLARLAGFIDSSSIDAQGKRTRVSLTLGERPDDSNSLWKAKWRELNDPAAWSDWAVRRYMEQLVAVSPELKLGFAYEVREAYNGRLKYHLVFASRSTFGFPIMNDYICEEDQTLIDRSEAARVPQGQTSLFETRAFHKRTAELQAIDRTLSEEVLSWGLANNGSTRQQLLETFTLKRLGAFKKRHYREVIKRLERDGRVEIGPGKDDNRRLWFR